jgi:hypothetical protein
MNEFARALSGCAINVSVSESDDSVTRGFPGWQVNRTTLQVVTALYGQGVTVVFGHDWRNDGVMEAVCNFARQVQPPIPLPGGEAAASGQPLLLNVLPWPTKALLPEQDLKRLRSTLRVVFAGLPEGLRHVAEQDAEKLPEAVRRYLRARGLTHLRRRLTTLSHARLCLGGRSSRYDGRYPGIIEEAYFAVAADKPLYVAGLLGGAAGKVTAAIEGGEMPADFCEPARTSAIDVYQHPPIAESVDTADDRVIDRQSLWRTFAQAGRSGRIAKANGLSKGENEELFHTPVIDRVIELILLGLGRLKRDRRLEPIDTLFRDLPTGG